MWGGGGGGCGWDRGAAARDGRDFAGLEEDRGLPVGTVEAWAPPADAVLFPEEPDLAGVVGEHVFAVEAFGYGEAFGTLADDHDVRGAAHDGFGYAGSMADVGEGRGGAGAAGGAVHDAGVEFDDAVFVGEAAVADAVVVGVVFAGLADVERGFEGVGAVLEEGVGFGDGVVAGLAGDDDGALGGGVDYGLVVSGFGGLGGGASGYSCG